MRQRFLVISCAVTTAILAAGAILAKAQDPIGVSPKNYRLVFQNEKVRLLEHRDKPGDISATHWYPQDLVHVLSSHKRKFTFPDGNSVVAQMKAGETIWAEAGSHAGENVGTADSHVLISELEDQGTAVGADSQSQIEQNKILVRRLSEALQQGDLRTLNDIQDPKGLVHTSRGTREAGGPFSDLKDACPMCVVMNPRHLTIDLMIAEGDLVAMRATARGTQSGPLGNIPASGKEITATYHNVYRIRGGRIVEVWVSMDGLSLMEQLGMKLCPKDAPK